MDEIAVAVTVVVEASTVLVKVITAVIVEVVVVKL